MGKRKPGETRGKKPERRPSADPRHPAGTPRPPDFLTGLALTEWRRVVPILEEIGKLTLADRSVLVGYCVAWAQYDTAQRLVAGLDSPVVSSSRGLPVLHPVIQARDKALAQVLECSKRLGLSPYDRERMKPPIAAADRAAEDDVLAYGNEAADDGN